jgi:hypothetical protein
MRAAALLLTLSLSVYVAGCRRAGTSNATAIPPGSANFFLSSNPKKPDFESQIKPIFQARCQPCHFSGGKVYDRMPFDQPQTITRLGEKLFTRIKDKEGQRVIREFLSQP